MIEAVLSARAKAIAQGLIRARRAEHHGVFDQGMLKLRCSRGGHYWISLDGSRVLRGRMLVDADELQPKFFDAMERSGR